MKKSLILFALLLCSFLKVQAATFEVNSTADTNDDTCDIVNCTLREAINAANTAPGDDTIQFASNVTGTIQLASALPVTNIIIEGPGASLLSIESNSPYTSAVFGSAAGTSSIRNLTVRGSRYSFNIANAGNLTVENCVIRDSTYRGGISNAGNLLLKNSVVTNNMANLGGGLYNAGTLTLDGCTIDSNSANQGGGIWSSGNLVVTNTTISNNSANHGGGIWSNGNLVANNSTISGNTAGRAGAVESYTLMPDDSQPTSSFLQNCTISGNKANICGGYENDRGLSTFENCTIFGNDTPQPYNSSYPNGIYVLSYYDTQTVVHNSIITNNAVGDVGYETPGKGFVSRGYNMVGYGNGVSSFKQPGDKIGQAYVSSFIGPLADNGGPTKTHAILSDCPAISGGDPSFAGPPDFDQRGAGFSRVQGGRIDVGAYEALAISVNDVSINEGDSGSANANFTVALSQASLQTVTVNYATVNGTSREVRDYKATNGILSFAPGETSKTISVPVLGDLLVEENETFFVNLSNATNSAIVDAQGVGTIVNDDTLPHITISEPTIQEGDGGTNELIFVAKLSKPYVRDVTVDYSTLDGTAKVADNDYLPTSGTLTFAPDEISKTVSVVINGDTIFENNEKFALALSNPVNATLTRTMGAGSINNDDLQPELIVNDAIVVEGDSGSKNMAFTLSLSATSGKTVRVNYVTADGLAKAGKDYLAKSGMIDFAPGQSSKTVNVPIIGDILSEADERFSLSLSDATNAEIERRSGIGTIINDDAPPSISISDANISEGHSGSKNLTFTLTLSTASDQTIKVSYATQDGTAISSSDYIAKNGLVDFAAGQTSKTITVAVIGDKLFEENEVFYLNLSAPVNATIARAKGTATINNDDASG